VQVPRRFPLRLVVASYFFHVFGALAEFERNLIRDPTNAGLSAARARGRNGGRAKKLDDKQRELAVRLYNEGKSVKDICHSLGISKPTFYRYVREEAAAEEPKN